MTGGYKLFITRFFILLNSVAVLIFLLSCLAPYLNPEKWWAVSMLGFGFIFIVFTLLLFIIFWGLYRPRYILISLVPLLIGYKSISSVFALNKTTPFNYAKPRNAIRIATWNVARFVEWHRNNNAGSHARLQMMELLKAQNADIICLQEFFTSTDPVYYNNIKYIKEKMGYPYHYFSWDGDGTLQWFGEIIFSRYPIIGGGVLHYPKPAMPESLIHADIIVGKDTVRIYNTHLQSVQFRKKDFEQIDQIKSRGDSLLQNSQNIYSKLKRGIIYRSKQADIAKGVISQSTYPYVVCGDFNDVPNSYTYFTIRGNLRDAFLEKSFGVGRTFTGISPTLRIDYLLTSPQFSVLQYNRLEKSLSDHYMQVADVQLLN